MLHGKQLIDTLGLTLQPIFGELALVVVPLRSVSVAQILAATLLL